MSATPLTIIGHHHANWKDGEVVYTTTNAALAQSNRAFILWDDAQKLVNAGQARWHRDQSHKGAPSADSMPDEVVELLEQRAKQRDEAAAKLKAKNDAIAQAHAEHRRRQELVQKFGLLPVADMERLLATASKAGTAGAPVKGSVAAKPAA